MPTSRAGRGQRGYTLVELLVVLTIIALIAALAAPIVGRDDRVALRSTAEEVAAVLSDARGRALTLNRDVAVDFDTATGQIDAVGARVMLPAGTDMRLVTAQSELLGPSAGRIRFHATGGATGGQVTLRRGDVVIDVRVDWFDGRVEVLGAPG